MEAGVTRRVGPRSIRASRIRFACRAVTEGSMDQSRRLFVANTAASALALALVGCGGSGGGYSSPPPAMAPPPPAPPPPPPPSALAFRATAITGNHGHALTTHSSGVDSI